MLFAETLSVACDPVPGTVVAQVPELRGSTVSNASIAILPNGNYVASCTGVTDGAALFVSKDRGATWSLLVENVTALNHIRNYYNLFVFEGALYMMGAGAGKPEPADFALGGQRRDLDRTHRRHERRAAHRRLPPAAVPVVVHDGPPWRPAKGGSDTSIKRPFVISAPVDADLLRRVELDEIRQPDHRQRNDRQRKDRHRADRGQHGRHLRRSLQHPSGQQPADQPAGGQSHRHQPVETHLLRLQRLHHLPRGGKKFTIRYDEQSRRYWTLSNPAASKYVGMKNDGLYLNGITRDLIRNRLVLCYSTDLITWDFPTRSSPKTKTPSSTDSNTSIGSSTATTSWPYAAWPAPRTPRLALPSARRQYPEFPAHRRLPKPLTAMRRIRLLAPLLLLLCTGKPQILRPPPRGEGSSKSGDG